MGLDDWEILDYYEDDENKLCSAKCSVDQKVAFDLNDTDRSISISISDQHVITARAACHRQEIDVEAGEDTVLQVFGQKSIGDVKRESSDVHEEVEGKEEGVNSRRMNVAMEDRQKWGRAAMCSFGIAVAATICSAIGKP